MMCIPPRLWRATTAASALFLFAIPLASAFTIPVNDGFVTDATGTLTSAQDTQLEETLRTYKDATSNEIAVLMVGTLSGSSINEVGVQVGREWGVGSKENDNGILMLIALVDREMAILTGYGLEGAVPDIVARGIIDEDITPHFRDGNYFDGIVAGVDSLQKHIGGEYTAKRYSDEASGAWPGFLFFLFIVFDLLAAFLGRTKSWWLGGVLGGIFGLVLSLAFGWWVSIPGLLVLGLLFDFVVSRLSIGKGRHRGGFWGGWGGGVGGGKGGFGGFGGGSFGGGGASGRW